MESTTGRVVSTPLMMSRVWLLPWSLLTIDAENFVNWAFRGESAVRMQTNHPQPRFLRPLFPKESARGVCPTKP